VALWESAFHSSIPRRFHHPDIPSYCYATIRAEITIASNDTRCSFTVMFALLRVLHRMLHEHGRSLPVPEHATQSRSVRDVTSSPPLVTLPLREIPPLQDLPITILLMIFRQASSVCCSFSPPSLSLGTHGMSKSFLAIQHAVSKAISRPQSYLCL
jgi:hypothetical protein